MIATRPLGSVVAVSAGQPAPKAGEFADEGFPFIRAGSLENLLNGGTLADCKKVPETTAQKNRLRLYPKDTVVFAKSGMSAMLGRVYRLPEPAYVVSHLAALSPTGDYDPGYLTYWLRWNPPCHLVKDPAYPSIRTSEIEQVQVPSLPLSEQERIAAILDQADALRRKRDLSLAMANQLLKSAFLQLFGDPLTNPNGFRIEEIGRHLSKERPGTQSGPFGSALKKHEYTQTGIPVWGVDSVQHNEFINDTKLFISKEKFEQLKRYAVEVGDILISRAGTVGRMCIAKPTVGNSIISTNLIRVALDKSSLLPEYFVALFTYVPHRLGALKANNKENAFTFLNPKTLTALEIPIPPIELQEQYKRLTGAVEDQVCLEREQLAGLNKLFSSLSQRAFDGKL